MVLKRKVSIVCTQTERNTKSHNGKSFKSKREKNRNKPIWLISCI